MNSENDVSRVPPGVGTCREMVNDSIAEFRPITLDGGPLSGRSSAPIPIPGFLPSSGSGSDSDSDSGSEAGLRPGDLLAVNGMSFFSPPRADLVIADIVDSRLTSAPIPIPGAVGESFSDDDKCPQGSPPRGSISPLMKFSMLKRGSVPASPEIESLMQDDPPFKAEITGPSTKSPDSVLGLLFNIDM